MERLNVVDRMVSHLVQDRQLCPKTRWAALRCSSQIRQ